MGVFEIGQLLFIGWRKQGYLPVARRRKLLKKNFYKLYSTSILLSGVVIVGLGISGCNFSVDDYTQQVYY